MENSLKGLIKSFTKSVDLYNYLLKHHHRRVAIAAYHIAKEMHMNDREITELVIAAALHDIGALTVEERDQLIKMDIDDPHPHARLGWYMLSSFKPFKMISEIVYYHHWPFELDNKFVDSIGRVPIQSYVLHLADRIDILIDPDKEIVLQRDRIQETILSYRGTLFHPEVVDAFLNVARKVSFWKDIDNMDIYTLFDQIMLEDYDIELSLDLMEEFANMISRVIDTRSRFTISHSFGVSAVAYEISGLLGYDETKKRKLRIAGLLHDIGKIAIPSSIIEKEGALNPDERSEIQTHAYFSSLILRELKGFQDVALWAMNHHENHDGSGYPNRISKELTEEMDVIAFADIFTALSENRPYREGLEVSEIIEILKTGFVVKHGEKIFKIIETNADFLENACKKAIIKGENRYQSYCDFAHKVASN